MPYTNQTTDFWGWYNRHNTRFEYSHFENAGIDLFTSGPNQNPDRYADLNNVLPSLSGGFRRRWGTSVVTSFNTTTTPINPLRMFAYNAFQDQSNPGTTTTRNLFIFTDDTNFLTINDDGSTYTGFTPSIPSSIYTVVAPNYMGAVTSRNFFYYGQGNGLFLPQKIDMTQTSTNLQSNMGISPAPDGSVSFAATPYIAYGPSTWVPTASVTGGGGTGATVSVNTVTAVVNGVTLNFVQSLTVTNGGTGYTSSPGVTLSAGGTTSPVLLAYVDLNSNNSTHGQLVAVLPGGPMQFAAGRQYTGAYQNSKTGHTSDICYSHLYTTVPAPLPPSSQPYVWAPLTQGLSPGWFFVLVTVFLGSTTLASLDSQVDKFLLLATSDGGSLETLYQDDIIPLSSFAVNSGWGSNLTYQYIDLVPDSYSEAYPTGTTLLTQNLWVQPAGTAIGTIGIAGNTAPPKNFYYPTAHQGRIFSTDGKTVFYSKSIDEVVTSTGLITSKWEEAWPGTYQLPIALNNDNITCLKSDGQVLHVGTTKAVYSVYGTDATNFSVPGLQFSQTGILNNDCFTPVYSQGQPAGFMWVTPDYKILWSDFNNYEDVGVPIYPLLQSISNIETAKMNAITSGPYNFVFFSFLYNNGSASQLLVYETRLRAWYRWTVATNAGASTYPGQYLTFAYESPVTGVRNLYYFQTTLNNPPPTPIPTGNTNFLFKFDSTKTQDSLNNDFINWNVITNFQALGDPFAFKVLNEIELISDDTGNIIVSIFGANTQNDFESPFSIGGIFTPVLGPLNTFKIYLAGQHSSAKFYQFQLGSKAGNTGATTEVLTAFQVEAYPMARI